MEQRAQYSNGCHLSKNSNRYTTLFDLDSIKNVHIRGTDNDDDVTSTSQSDSQESKGCGILMEHTNENRAGKFSELRSELPLKRKRRDIDAETSYNTSFQRDDESIEEDGNYENHISEEHYRNMLGEHVQRYKKSRLKEESRVASTRMGTPNIKHNFNLKSRKPSHEYQNTVNEGKTAFGTEPSSPDILSVYNGSHRGASHSHYDHNSIQGQQMLASSLLEIYDGITYRIPPVYDKLAPLLNMPTFADICIEEQLLMGRLDSRSLSRIMASEKYPKCCNRTGMGESFTEFNSLQERLKSGQNFKLQVFEADLSPMQQDALGTKRLIMSETGTLQYCYVKILEKGDSYEIIERKLPRKQPMKKDPSTIEKEDTEKVGKCWANIVKRDIPKHVKTFFLHAKKQANDAKKLSDNCQKEVKARTARSLKMAKGAAGRTRKLTRDMLMFWKRVDKEQAEIRKKEEREAAEAQKREEELREAKRHQQRLNFLISQTELYSHFMQNKSSQVIDSSTRAAGASVDEAETGQNLNATRAAEEDDPEEIAYKEEAIRVARNAVSEQKRKTSAFDNECLKFRRANSVSGEGIPDGSNNIDLLNPSSMPLTSSVQQPKLFRGTLKEYQLKGLQWLVNCYEQGLNGILADEMGLGKTIQAVAFLAHLAEEKNIWGPFLVVAPSSVLNNWADEFSKFCPDLKALPYWGPSVERSVLRKSIHRKYLYRRDASFHVVITSYQLVITDEKYFKRVGWQYMVLDEAQAIKSSMSIRWKTLLGFNCRNRLLLTGTPIQNNMAELWALLHFIMPTLFDSHEQFNEWFSKGIENHAEHGGTLNEHQLNRLHAILKPFMLRRVKKDVITEMTSKREVTVDCMLSSRQQAFYRAIKNKISVAELMTSARGHLNEKKVANLMNIVIQLRKVCNHPELFERNEGRTFMYFGKRSYPLLPAPFGEMEEIHYAGNRNPISYRIPKLVYRESCLEQPISSKSDLEFSKKFLHHRLNIFSPDNIYQSIFAPNGETETNFTVRSGTFGFSRMIDLSPTELAFLANGHLLERVLFSVAKWDKLFLDSIIEESSKTDGMYYNDSIEESKTRAITRLLMLPTRSEWSTLRRKHATGPYQMPFEELAMSHDDRFLRNIKLLKSVYSFIPPTHAPPIDVTCSDRGFAYQQAETFHHPWLKRLLVGFARTSEFNGPARPQEPPPLIQEIDSHLHAQRPLLKLTNRIFGSSPPLQSFDLAKMLMDSGKLQTLDALLKRLRAENHRVLLFAQMTKMLNILEDYMNYRKYKYRRLDGSSTIAERRDTVKDFQDRQDIFVFLLSTRAGGVGINLTAADTVIFYESDWNPTLDLQAMDRAHRLGQTKEVTVYRLICKETIEEKILLRASQKNTVQQLVMTGGQADGHGDGDILSTEDVLSLLLDDAQIEQKVKEHGSVQNKDKYRKRKGTKAFRLSDDGEMCVINDDKGNISGKTVNKKRKNNIDKAPISKRSKKSMRDGLHNGNAADQAPEQAGTTTVVNTCNFNAIADIEDENSSRYSSPN